jgi:3-(3-hydroxy-phenyl)propionate hydroxylase
VAEYTFRAKFAERWRRGNIFLLGDAAHLTPPFIGQGMGAGLRDAMNLAWKLAGVLDGGLPPAVLDTYEQERKPHTRFMIGMALSMGWAMTAGGDVGNLIRRLLVPRLHLIPGLRDKLIESRTPALRRSALVTKSRAPWQLAGTLCPNALVANGIRLDTVLGDGFSMVTTARPPAFQCGLLDERGATLHIAEPGSELAVWLRRGRVTAAIIRPDHTVMCASRDLSALCAAMPAFHRASLSTRKAPSK